MFIQEFYVTLEDNVKGIKQLNALIQQHAKDTLMNKWKVDDICLVFCRCPLAITDTPIKKWIRGKIINLNSAQNTATCFLTDYGYEVNIELSSLMEMPEKYDRVLEGASKCHLSSCIPTGKNFSRNSI